jgi:hypothetical protein
MLVQIGMGLLLSGLVVFFIYIWVTPFVILSFLMMIIGAITAIIGMRMKPEKTIGEEELL